MSVGEFEEEGKECDREVGIEVRLVEGKGFGLEGKGLDGEELIEGESRVFTRKLDGSLSRALSR